MRKVRQSLAIVLSILMTFTLLPLNSIAVFEDEKVLLKVDNVEICPDGEHDFEARVAEEKYIRKAVSANKCGTTSYYMSCTICGMSSKGTDEEWYFSGPYIHNGNSIPEERIEPTCEEEGLSEGELCSKCYLYIVSPEYIPPLGHDLAKVEAKAPTCTTEGNIEYYVCQRDDCGKMFKDKDESESITADETKIAVSNDHVAGEAVVENVTPATCVSTGKCDEVVYCVVCNAEISRNVVTIEKTKHEFINYEYNNDATCTENGTETATCENCSVTDTREKENSATGHSYGEPTWSWTGNEKAVAAFSCLKNDDVKVINADISERVPVLPTCFGEGEIVYTATVIFNEAEYTNEKSDVISVLLHTPDESGLVPQKESTCDENGMKEHYICKFCGEKIVEENGNYIVTSDKNLLIEKTDHDFSAKVQDSKYYLMGPSTNNCGSKAYYYSCSGCGLSSEGYEEECIFFTPFIHKGNLIPDESSAIEATCTQEGRTADLICTKCDFIVENGTVTEKLGHSALKTEAVVPTCKKAGNIEYYTCQRENCGKVFADEACENEITIEETILPVTNKHTPVSADNGIPAKCEIDGKEADKICSVCGILISEGKTIEALGHSGGTATCVSKAVCELCGELYGELDIGNHVNIVIDNAVEATCSQSGLTEGRHCSDCNRVLAEQKATSMKNHTDSDNDGYCDSCKTKLDSSKPSEPLKETDKCDCDCHKTGIKKFFWQISNFFHKIFKMEKYRKCSCGEGHW